MKLPTFRVASLAPGAALDYGIDATEILDELADTLASFEWDVPAGLTKGAENTVGNVGLVWLSSATPASYRVVGWINTTGGRRVPVVLLLDVLTL